MNDLNCISFWLPELLDAGIPTPRTNLVRMQDAVQVEIFNAFDGIEPDEAIVSSFFAELEQACDDVGWPAFLRTGHISGKHEWRRTCHVPGASDVRRRVYALVEHSAMASLVGLPTGVWAAREMLPVDVLGVCPAYGDMPVVLEFRTFVEDGSVRCIHPYWPAGALQAGGCANADGVARSMTWYRQDDEERSNILALAAAASAAVSGAWSVDVLRTSNGWMVTDMARAKDSFHWPGCANASKGRQ